MNDPIPGSKTTEPSNSASPKKKRKTLRNIVILVVVLAAVLVVPRLLSPKKVDYERPLVPVVVQKAQKGTLYQNFYYSGVLKPEYSTTVVPKLAGKVLEVLVKEGERVKEGQPLMRIEDDVVRLQMEQARASYNAAKAQYDKANKAVRPEELASAKASLQQAENDLEVAKANFERSKNLYEAGSLARSKYEEADNQIKSAETQVENARRQVKIMEEGARPEDIAMAKAQADASAKQLELAQLQLDNALITAPIAGSVVKIHTERGQFVGAGNPLLSLVSEGTIFALISVPETNYGVFYQKTKDFLVKIYPLAYPDQDAFSGKITKVSEIIDAASRSFEVEIGIDNPKNLLKPGMYVRVEASSPLPGEFILVPKTAVQLRNGKSVVFVQGKQENSSASGGVPVIMKEVLSGEQNDSLIQIREGLEDGDTVIVQGNAFLEDLQYVQVVETR